MLAMVPEPEQGHCGSRYQGCIDSVQSLTGIFGKRKNRCCRRSGTVIGGLNHIQAVSGKTGEKDIVILKEARQPHRSNLAIRTRSTMLLLAANHSYAALPVSA
ncbi:MAG: hypothetical protein BRC52_03175 [Cyanobacteria bacterium SW_5_48_44]|nr:MAG: hypothetical protein BRC52_03175 [Cyanobacteria bacterium SW_5_48_44]